MPETRKPSRRRRRALAGVAVGVPVVVGVAALEAARRRDRRELAADPEWEELRRPQVGRAVAVVSADGTPLHAEVFGPEGAPAVVLCHGWTCDVRFWHYQIRDLAGQCRVIAWDQRGHGRSGLPQSMGYTTEALSADLDAVLSACLAPGERCVLAGHSMGGMTVVAWAGAHAQDVSTRVAAAMLLDTGMGDLVAQSLILRSVFAKRLLAAPTQTLMSQPAPLGPSTPVSRRLYRSFVMSPRATEGQVLFCEQMLLDCPAEVRAGFARAFPSVDLYEQVPRLTPPTSIVVGELDRIEPPWHARRLARTLPHVVELVELPGIGHMVPIEAHEEVTRRLRALVRDHLGAPALAAAGG